MNACKNTIKPSALNFFTKKLLGRYRDEGRTVPTGHGGPKKALDTRRLLYVSVSYRHMEIKGIRSVSYPFRVLRASSLEFTSSRVRTFTAALDSRAPKGPALALALALDFQPPRPRLLRNTIALASSSRV